MLKYLLLASFAVYACAQVNYVRDTTNGAGPYYWDLIPTPLTADKVMEILASSVAGTDYPIYNEVPETSFTCEGKDPGYYADPEAGCQAFRRCGYFGREYSYLCPNMTLFNQLSLTCAWFFDVDCSRAVEFYPFANSRIYIQDMPLHDTPPADYQPPFIAEYEAALQAQLDAINSGASSSERQGRIESGDDVVVKTEVTVETASNQDEAKGEITQEEQKTEENAGNAEESNGSENNTESTQSSENNNESTQASDDATATKEDTVSAEGRSEEGESTGAEEQKIEENPTEENTGNDEASQGSENNTESTQSSENSTESTQASDDATATKEDTVSAEGRSDEGESTGAEEQKIEENPTEENTGNAESSQGSEGDADDQPTEGPKSEEKPASDVVIQTDGPVIVNNVAEE